jgi:hypothetical protein
MPWAGGAGMWRWTYGGATPACITSLPSTWGRSTGTGNAAQPHTLHTGGQLSSSPRGQAPASAQASSVGVMAASTADAMPVMVTSMTATTSALSHRAMGSLFYTLVCCAPATPAVVRSDAHPGARVTLVRSLELRGIGTSMPVACWYLRYCSPKVRTRSALLEVNALTAAPRATRSSASSRWSPDASRAEALTRSRDPSAGSPT